MPHCGGAFEALVCTGCGVGRFIVALPAPSCLHSGEPAINKSIRGNIARAYKKISHAPILNISCGNQVYLCQDRGYTKACMVHMEVRHMDLYRHGQRNAKVYSLSPMDYFGDDIGTNDTHVHQTTRYIK